MAVLVFLAWYYPIGLQQNAVVADQVAERGALMFLFILTFLNFAGTFTNMVIAGIDTAEGAWNLGNLLFSLSLIFCGYVLPGIFLFYRLPRLYDRLQQTHTNRTSQGPSHTCRPSRLLDIHVPRLPLHLPRFWHAISRPRQRAHHLRRRRTLTIHASFALELLYLPRTLYRNIRRLPHPAKHELDHGMRVL